jgi:hypothetical protein
MGLGTKLEGLKHRHGRANPRRARDIATSCHHAALATAHNDGLVAQFRLIALMDGREKGIAINMGDR